MRIDISRSASPDEIVAEMDRRGRVLDANAEYIDRLKAVNRDCEKEIIALRAENERLGRDYQTARDAHDRRLAENERLRAALAPFACTCSVKGMGAGGNCTKGSGECMCWNARAALNDQPAPGKGE